MAKNQKNNEVLFTNTGTQYIKAAVAILGLVLLVFFGEITLGNQAQETGYTPSLLAGGVGTVYYDSTGAERVQRGAVRNQITDAYTGRFKGCGGPTSDGSTCSKYDYNRDGRITQDEIDRFFREQEAKMRALEQEQQRLQQALQQQGYVTDAPGTISSLGSSGAYIGGANIDYGSLRYADSSVLNNSYSTGSLGGYSSSLWDSLTNSIPTASINFYKVE